MGDIRQQQTDSPRPPSSYAEKMGLTWPPALSFPHVLEKAKSYDKSAISMLYRRFLPTVYRYVLSRVADIPTAEDLTSETFVAMIRGIGSTRAEEELGFAAWLLGIARNQVLMHFRRMKGRPEVEYQAQRSGESQSVAEEGDPLLVLMARETWAETVDALNLLTEEQRQVVLFRCVLGYSTEQVAVLMARQPGTIRALQFRALASLTRHLSATTGTKAKKPGRRRNHAG